MCLIQPHVPKQWQQNGTTMRSDGQGMGVGAEPARDIKATKAIATPTCSVKLLVFIVNIFLGLILSELVALGMDSGTYATWKMAVKLSTMFSLSYIMINVGFEFSIDKSRLGGYGREYLVAMTAAGFPWIFVSLYFMFALGEGHNLPWKQALLAGRFAAPTSAGLLFTMLEAAGMKETWIFKKARILAIFDDLDTLLLMVPLKAIIVGFKWELAIDLLFVIACLTVAYRYMHATKLSTSWQAIATYSLAVTLFCEMIHFLSTHDTTDPHDLVETVHLEVLLPAFAVGCIAPAPEDGHTEKSDTSMTTFDPAIVSPKPATKPGFTPAIGRRTGVSLAGTKRM